jgi:hypothetical protein
MNLRISGLTLVILAVANGGINAQPTTSTQIAVLHHRRSQLLNSAKSRHSSSSKHLQLELF